MTLVTKTLKDGDGVAFNGRFWDLSGGFLVPAPMLLDASGDSLFGDRDDALWNGTDAAPSLVSLEKYKANRLASIATSVAAGSGAVARKRLAPTVTITAQTYAVNTVVGGVIQCTGAASAAGLSGTIRKMVIASKGARTNADTMNFELYDTAPAAHADGSTWNGVTNTDLLNRIDSVALPEWKDVKSPSLCVISNLDIPYTCRDGSATTSIWIVPWVTAAAGITFASTTDLAIALVVEWGL